MSKKTSEAFIEKIVDLLGKDPAKAKSICERFMVWKDIVGMVKHKAHMELCRKDVNTFIEYVIVDPQGNPVKQAEFHKEWHRMIQEEDWCLIGAPRGHGKTIQISSTIIFALGNNPNLRIKIIGSGDDKAKEILGMVKTLLKESHKVHQVFPQLKIDKGQDDTTTKFTVFRNIVQRDPSVEASGVFSAGAGGRADWLICDDVVDPRNALVNPTLREQVKSVMAETWFSLVSPVGGKVVWICTPYHIADASHSYKNSGSWAVFWRPAIKDIPRLDENGKPLLDEDGEKIVDKEILWPEVWSEQRLMRRKEQLGERTFARQFLLKAVSDEERTFPESSIEQSFDYSLADIGEDIPDHWPCFAGVDLASTFGKRSKYSAIWVLAQEPDSGKLYLKDLWRGQVRFSGVLTEIANMWKKHKFQMMFVESNQYQVAVVQALEDDYPEIPVEGHHTSASSKASEEIGLPALNVAFERGHFAIPAARFPIPPEEESNLSAFMVELREYPSGETSDTLIAFWLAWRASRDTDTMLEDIWVDAIAGL